MKFLTSQFGHPQGLLGHLVGIVMAYENRERNHWAVSLLTIRPEDYVLEIGFGPGLAIQEVATVAREGFVAGIDQSAVMVQQARKRTAATETERVEIQQGSITALPYCDVFFDKVYAINVLHHCAHSLQALHEMWRVLKPGGLAAIVEQPRAATSDAQVQALAEEWSAQLAAAGFTQIKRLFKPMRPATSIAVVGVK